MAWDPLGHFLPGSMFLCLSLGLLFDNFSRNFCRKSKVWLTYGILILACVGLAFEIYWESYRLRSVKFHQHQGYLGAYFCFFFAKCPFVKRKKTTVDILHFLYVFTVRISKIVKKECVVNLPVELKLHLHTTHFFMKCVGCV